MRKTALHVYQKGCVLRGIEVSNNPRVPLGLLQSRFVQASFTQGPG